MLSNSRLSLPWIACLCWAAVVAVALYTRPLFPIDETRYVSVAWEMWQRNDFLVPYLNGAPYSHKPPLLFWLMHAGWWMFGVNEITARLTAPFFGLLNLILLGPIARRLWPERKGPQRKAPLILMSFLLWTLFTTLTMFDMLVTFFVLLGAWALLQIREGRPWWGSVLFGLSIGGGILAKGPVVLLYLLPLLLLVPYWAPKAFSDCRRCWLLGGLFALILGAGIALLWAIPAANAGGEDYSRAILWSQTAGRVAKSFAHQRPFWWYLPILPLVLFPWSLVGRVWSGLKEQLSDSGSRFCISLVVPQILLLSLVSGKQVHYLLPTLPAIALLFARSLDSAPKGMRVRGPKWIAVGFCLLGGALLALPVLPPSLGLPSMSFGTSILWAGVILAAGAYLMLWKPESGIGLAKNLCVLMVVLIISVHFGVATQLRPYYDFTPMADKISEMEARGVAVAHMGKYHDQFQFLGRLKKPLPVIRSTEDLKNWSSAHPGGKVIYYQRNWKFPMSQALFFQPFRLNRKMGIFEASSLVDIIERGNNRRSQEAAAISVR